MRPAALSRSIRVGEVLVPLDGAPGGVTGGVTEGATEGATEGMSEGEGARAGGLYPGLEYRVIALTDANGDALFRARYTPESGSGGDSGGAGGGTGGGARGGAGGGAGGGAAGGSGGAPAGGFLSASGKGVRYAWLRPTAATSASQRRNWPLRLPLDSLPAFASRYDLRVTPLRVRQARDPTTPPHILPPIPSPRPFSSNP